MTLYEITQEMLIILKKIDGAFSKLDHTENEKEDKQKLLSLLEKDFNQKIISYAKIKKNLEAEEKELAEEIKRLQSRKKKNAAKIASIDLSIKESLLAMNKKTVHGPLFDIAIMELSPTLIVDDETKVPSEFLIPQPDKINKKALNKWAENNVVDEFGHYEPNFKLMIK